MPSCCPTKAFQPARGGGGLSDPISEGCHDPEIFGNAGKMVVTFPLIHDIIDGEDVSSHGEWSWCQAVARISESKIVILVIKKYLEEHASSEWEIIPPLF